MDQPTTRLGISVYFEDLDDPRRAHLRRHDPMDVIVITLCAVICGCETWEDVALRGRSKHAWLKPDLRLPNGIPPHDTFNRLFRLLDPGPPDAGARSWVADLHRVAGLTVIAVDGKAVRHSFDTASAKTARPRSARGPSRTAWAPARWPWMRSRTRSRPSRNCRTCSTCPGAW
jgi:hypothetical protein